MGIEWSRKCLSFIADKPMVQWFSEIIDKGCSPLMGVILRHCLKGFSPNQQHFLPKWGFPTNKTLSLGVFHPLFKYVCHLVIFCFVRTQIIPNGQYWQGSIANYRLIIGSCQVGHQNFSVRAPQVNSHTNSESSVSHLSFSPLRPVPHYHITRDLCWVPGNLRDVATL